MLSRLGPAPLPLLCALVIVGLAAVGAFVPIGRPARTLPADQAFGMLTGAVMLAAWAVAVGIRAWDLTRGEAGATVLVPPMSPGLVDVVFSVPLVVVVPVAAVGLRALLHGGRPGLAAGLCAAFTVALLGLREVDRVSYVRDGRATVRAGWLWARTEAAPPDAVRGVRVVRDTYRGAAAWVVKLDLADPAQFPQLAGIEARYRVEGEAEAEAERWRRALRGGA